jgi:DNA-binding transcriptional ArsR family regulator
MTTRDQFSPIGFLKRALLAICFTCEFGVAKTTMHHHLGTLRAAGLVRAQSNDKMYSLRQNMLSEVSELLNAYLKGKPQ